MTFSAGTRTSVKDGEPGRRALDAELVLELAGVEAGAVGLDEEGGRPVRLAVRLGEDDVDVGDRRVRDPVLRAVDHPPVAVRDGEGPHRRRIRAGLGLGERERRRHLPRREAREPALLLRVRAEPGDGQGAELLDHQDERGRGARLGDLLHGDLEHQRARAGTAVAGLEGQAEDVVLGEQPAHVPRVLARPVDLGRAWADPLVDDLADGVRKSTSASGMS
jgi:hypothetical protein